MVGRVKSLLRDIEYGLRGLLYWAPAAWRWRSWDYNYSLKMLRHSLRALEVAVRTGCHEDGPRDARDIRVAIALLGREIDDHIYIEQCGMRSLDEARVWKMNGEVFPLYNRRDVIHAVARMKSDRRYLYALLHKKMPRWWD